MKSMNDYARQYQHEKRGKEVVDMTSITDYSFKTKTVPKKENEQPKECVIMKSWFLKI